MSKILTTASGAPVADNQNSRSAGPRGPLLLDDFHLIENSPTSTGRTSRNAVYTPRALAHTVPSLSPAISPNTPAPSYSSVSARNRDLPAFSTVGGERGSADTERDPRGFAVKFYTEEGNWDIVGNNTPVFFIRDPLNSRTSSIPKSGTRSPI